MEPESLAMSDDPGAWPPAAESVDLAARHDPRLAGMRQEHFEFLWRSVRRLGVPESDADDAVQQIFLVAHRRLASITPGSERAFLFGTAIRVAAHARRAARRRGAVLVAEDSDEARDAVSSAPSAEDLLEQRRARALLDEVLESLPMEARAVFVLFELEELTLAEIAELLAIPPGTVASRLRRARELFQTAVARLDARRKRSLT